MNCKELIKTLEEYQMLEKELTQAKERCSDLVGTQEKCIEARFQSLYESVGGFCGSPSFRSVIRNLCYLYGGILSVSGGNLTYRGRVPAPLSFDEKTVFSVAQQCINDIKSSVGLLAKRQGDTEAGIQKLCVAFVTLRLINARIPMLKSCALRTAHDDVAASVRGIEQRLEGMLKVCPDFGEPEKVWARIEVQKSDVRKKNGRFHFSDISVSDDYSMPISLPFAKNAFGDEYETDIRSWNPTEDGILHVNIPCGRYEIAADFIIGLTTQFLYAYPMLDKQILYCAQKSLSQMDYFLQALKDECKATVFFGGKEQFESDNFYHEMSECFKSMRMEVKRRSNLFDAVSAENIYQYNATQDVDVVSAILVILHDYPNGFVGFKDLGYFFRECARFGIFFAVLQTGEQNAESSKDICDPSQYRRISCELNEDGGIEIDGHAFEGVSVDRASIRPLMRNLAKNAEKGKKHAYLSYEEIGFGQTDYNADGYCTKISVPVGKVEGKILHLHFATSTSEQDQKSGIKAPLAYLIVGSPKSGKSTLIDSLIINGSMAYSPDDLIFYLLDFKDGVAASFYDGKNAIPHVRMIASRNKEEDADIILSGLLTEKERRNDLIKSRDTSDIAGYNSKSGKKLPRIIVIVDECQNLFASEKLAAKCETLAREGRSAGIHLVLASQNASMNMMKHAGDFIDGRFCFFMGNRGDAEQVINSAYTKALHVDVPAGSGLAYMSTESGANCEKIRVAFHGGDENGSRLEYNRQIREKWAKKNYKIHLIKAGENSALRTEGFTVQNNPLVSDVPATAMIGENYFDQSDFLINFKKLSSHSVFLLGEQEAPFSDILTSVMVGALACDAQIKLIDESNKEYLEKFFARHPNVTRYSSKRYMTALSEVYDEFERRRSDFRAEYKPYFFIINSLYRMDDYNRNTVLEDTSVAPLDADSFEGDIRGYYQHLLSRKAARKEISGKDTLLSMIKSARDIPDFHIIVATNAIQSNAYDEKAVFSRCGIRVLQKSAESMASYIMENSFRRDIMNGLNENIVLVCEDDNYSKCRYFRYDMENENTRRLLVDASKKRI